MQDFRSLAAGELEYIVKHTSNHWRKIFNVYAKLLLDWHQVNNRKNLPESWQKYRDQELFQSHSQEALIFSHFRLNQNTQAINIIAGKTYAANVDLPPLVWLDSYFAINKQHRLIVAPYPDYRQLSNERITYADERVEISTTVVPLHNQSNSGKIHHILIHRVLP
ncbi:MAG: hypothetical protein B0W54_21025 [Cellvibrio sp. 79]|nr:MAG: hypothetical protein B0W54_21025 [Cellvibrio sp. 79]